MRSNGGVRHLWICNLQDLEQNEKTRASLKNIETFMVIQRTLTPVRLPQRTCPCSQRQEANEEGVENWEVGMEQVLGMGHWKMLQRRVYKPESTWFCECPCVTSHAQWFLWGQLCLIKWRDLEEVLLWEAYVCFANLPASSCTLGIQMIVNAVTLPWKCFAVKSFLSSKERDLFKDSSLVPEMETLSLN